MQTWYFCSHLGSSSLEDPRCSDVDSLGEELTNESDVGEESTDVFGNSESDVGVIDNDSVYIPTPERPIQSKVSRVDLPNKVAFMKCLSWRSLWSRSIKFEVAKHLDVREI